MNECYIVLMFIKSITCIVYTKSFIYIYIYYNNIYHECSHKNNNIYHNYPNNPYKFFF